jgi:quinol monooxygenase YgiN
MRCLYAEFTALPGREDELAGLVRQLVVDVRSEPGNVAFDAWVRRERPTEYVVFESYVDQAGFEAHLASEHSHTFNDRIADLVDGGGSHLTWLSPVGP